GESRWAPTTSSNGEAASPAWRRFASSRARRGCSAPGSMCCHGSCPNPRSNRLDVAEVRGETDAAMTKVEARAWASLAGLAVVMGLLLFVPAGTVRYWQAWLYLAVFMTASVAVTLYLMSHDPALLERRLRG